MKGGEGAAGPGLGLGRVRSVRGFTQASFDAGPAFKILQHFVREIFCKNRAFTLLIVVKSQVQGAAGINIQKKIHYSTTE